jgi:hypothetical protein
VARRARDVSGTSQTALQDSEGAGAGRCSCAVGTGKRQASQKLQKYTASTRAGGVSLSCTRASEHADTAWWLWAAGAWREVDGASATQAGAALRNTLGDTQRPGGVSCCSGRRQPSDVGLAGQRMPVHDGCAKLAKGAPEVALQIRTRCEYRCMPLPTQFAAP